MNPREHKEFMRRFWPGVKTKTTKSKAKKPKPTGTPRPRLPLVAWAVMDKGRFPYIFESEAFAAFYSGGCTCPVVKVLIVEAPKEGKP